MVLVSREMRARCAAACVPGVRVRIYRYFYSQGPLLLAAAAAKLLEDNWVKMQNFRQTQTKD